MIEEKVVRRLDLGVADGESGSIRLLVTWFLGVPSTVLVTLLVLG